MPCTKQACWWTLNCFITCVPVLFTVCILCCFLCAADTPVLLTELLTCAVHVFHSSLCVTHAFYCSLTYLCYSLYLFVTHCVLLVIFCSIIHVSILILHIACYPLYIAINLLSKWALLCNSYVYGERSGCLTTADLMM